MIDPTMKKPTVSPMYSPNVYATAPTIYHNPPPPSYEEPQAAWVPPVPPVQWVTPYGIAVQHHPIDAGKSNQGQHLECVCYDVTNILTKKKTRVYYKYIICFGRQNKYGRRHCASIKKLKTEQHKSAHLMSTVFAK